jgi:hypothetical protein
MNQSKEPGLPQLNRYWRVAVVTLGRDRCLAAAAWIALNDPPAENLCRRIGPHGAGFYSPFHSPTSKSVTGVKV